MIYMNNAATGFPKFPSAIQAMTDSLVHGELSTNRDSIISEDIKTRIFDLRGKFSTLLKAKKPHDIVFTASDTIALNMILQGIDWHNDDVLLIDAFSHNAIARPAMYLAKKFGVTVVSVGSIQDLTFALDVMYPGRVQAAVFSHGSNVTGDVIPAKEIGEILAARKVPFVLDVAQTIGLYPIDVEELHVSALAFAGHKGLNGLQGTGGFYIRKGFNIKPILHGGNGTESSSLTPEIVYPESFEVGTPAMHDLIGLYASMQEIEDIGYDRYGKTICEIAQYAYDELAKIPNVILYGDADKKLPVVSFNIKGITCKEVGQFLGTKNIVCRTGVHCAPMAVHKMGCMEEFGGSVRVSFGWGNSKKDVDTLILAVKEICGY